MKKAPDPAYDRMVKKAVPPSSTPWNTMKAFLVGGLICCFAQGLLTLYRYLGMTEDTASLAVSVTLIALTAALTGMGLFGKIAKFAGAGTFVPITGFANSVVSPAMEFQTEGKVLGTGAKMFTLAGPVIAYGCSLAAIYGLIDYCFVLNG